MLYIIYFEPYRVRKATKNDLESSNAFRFVSHLGSLLLGHPTPVSHDWSRHLGKGGNHESSSAGNRPLAAAL
jgi:hypothetical protein